MTYTIEETDLERQHLLAELLNPVSINALENISLKQGARILDIGCGLGDTTLMLHQRFPNSIITGLDGDASLITAATEEKKLLHANLDFVCSDALQLPFDDNSFDFVFTRYCLHHIPDAMAALHEMKRVCRTGGIVFAHEPDINALISYPESWAYSKHNEYIRLLFADALIGRKLISYFKKLQLQNISHRLQALLGDENTILKKFIAMTDVAIGPSLLQKKLATKEDHTAVVSELIRAQNDPDTIVIMPPSLAVWGTKVETSFSNYIYQHEK